MPETNRLGGASDCFELEFVEREATPSWAMKLGIRLHLAGLSLSNTVSKLEGFGVDRSRSTVHNWVQKADLQPTEGKSPDHVAVDETVIQIDDQRYWLYAAVDTDTNEFLHVKPGKRKISASLRSSLENYARNTTSKMLSFSLMARRGFKRHFGSTASDSNTLHMGIGTLSNAYIKI